jgi:uncharacterized protein YbcI
MKTQGESEAEISKGMQQIYIGLLGRRGADDIKTHVVNSTVLVLMTNVLTATELTVAKTPEGRRLIKEMCCSVVENSSAQFINNVVEATGVDVIDMHHDISVKTGKEVFVFSLSKEPTYRKKHGT